MLQGASWVEEFSSRSNFSTRPAQGRACGVAVYTENLIRIDGGGNRLTSAHNDRAVMVLASVVRFAVEVEEPS